MEALIMTAQLLLGLSILVGVHEAGHMLTAKFFGMRVEKFFIGFPPKLFGFKKGETEYGIGAIPLGGFVKITGMIDESLDTKELSKEPEPYEFRAKPAWQRLIVMMGGIVVNIITGIFIFIVLAYAYGEAYISKEELNKHGIVAKELAMDMGLETGDRILKVNGADFESFNELIRPEVLLNKNSYYTVERNGKVIDVPFPENFVKKFSEKESFQKFIEPVQEFSVKEVLKDSGAYKGGMKAGDKILMIDETPIRYYHELRQAAEAKKGREVNVKVERHGEVKDLKIKISPSGTLGFQAEPKTEVSRKEYSLGQSIVKGTGQAFSALWINVTAFGKIFTGDVPVTSLSGPIGIAKVFGGDWDWLRFWNLVGLLSMVLAFMNFLPIPALDGGHVMFLLYEMVAGRKPSDKFLENAQKVGMVILLALMIFAFGNDIFKSF
jgi:regulator of sigma E protease